jgi:hypothetical protein
MPNEELTQAQPETEQPQSEAQPAEQIQPTQPQAAPATAPIGNAFDQLLKQHQAQPASQQNAFETMLAQHKATSTPAPTQATSPEEKKGFLSGAYDMTIGGMAALGKQLRTYYANNTGKAASNTALGPIAMLTDAATDPEHPLHKMAVGLAEAHADTAKKAYAKVVEAQELAKNGDHKGAWAAISQAMGYGFGAALPVVGPAAVKAGEDIVTPEGKVNPYGAGEAAGLIGSVVAPEAVGRVAGKVKSPRPSTVPVAGENVPVSALQTAEPGAVAKIAKPFATAEGAQRMINEITQPAAVKATVSNLGKSVIDDVNPLRQMRGEEPLVHGTEELGTVDDIHQLAKKEAQKTYQPLDNAVHNDLEAWEQKVKDFEDANPEPKPRPKASPSTNKATAASKQYEAEAFKAEKQSWLDQREAFDADNPKPKTFTQLQDQIIKAERDIKLGSQVDTQKALENLPKYKAELKAFTDKHSDLVGPDELESANALYRKSKQYEFIADKINPVLRGTEGSPTPLKHIANSVSLETLESLPGKMKVEFGNPANPDPMTKLLGPDGMTNYNTVLEALKNPISGKESLMEWAAAHQTGIVGQTVGNVIPYKWLANKLLFDPKFGSRMVSSWRAAVGATKAIAPASKVVGAIGAGQQASHRYDPISKTVIPIE